LAANRNDFAVCLQGNVIKIVAVAGDCRDDFAVRAEG
jgi:hypothetical protein